MVNGRIYIQNTYLECLIRLEHSCARRDDAFNIDLDEAQIGSMNVEDLFGNLSPLSQLREQSYMEHSRGKIMFMSVQVPLMVSMIVMPWGG